MISKLPQPSMNQRHHLLRLFRRQPEFLAELPHLPKKVGQGTQHLRCWFVGMPYQNEPVTRRVEFLNARLRHG